jgi:hypothetical protein
VGAAVYKVLEQRVPEFLEIFQGGGYAGSGEDLELGDDGDFEAGEDLEDGYVAGDAADTVAAPGESKQFGDHIIVDKIKIKNEPKLISEAIRTMLARDDT